MQVPDVLLLAGVRGFCVKIPLPGADAASLLLCSNRAKELGRPMAVYEIVEDLRQLTDEPDFE
jgi:hypothetical protein